VEVEMATVVVWLLVNYFVVTGTMNNHE